MRATIYVTDDEPAIRTAIVKRLSRRQHAVTGFESGEDLLRAVTQHVPDLILLDLKMPGMGGLEALRQIRPIAPQTSDHHADRLWHGGKCRGGDAAGRL